MLVGLYTPQRISTSSYISGSYICYTSYIAKLPYKWLNSMVYGRYNELVHGGYFMVYKPLTIVISTINLYKPLTIVIPPGWLFHGL